MAQLTLTTSCRQKWELITTIHRAALFLQPLNDAEALGGEHRLPILCKQSVCGGGQDWVTGAQGRRPARCGPHALFTSPVSHTLWEALCLLHVKPFSI